MFWIGVLFWNSNRCILFNCSWAIFVQILVGFHIVCVAVFILGIWVLIAILLGSFCVHLSLLISESICVVSSHVLPKCYQIIAVLCLAYLFIDFGINAWSESTVFLILWCFLFLAWVFIFVFRSTQNPFHQFHCVFLLVYLAVFYFQIYRIPCFAYLCAGGFA